MASASAESTVGRGSSACRPAVKRVRAVSTKSRAARAARSVARLSAEIAPTFTVCVSVASEIGGILTCATQSSTILRTAPGTSSAGAPGVRGIAPDVLRAVPNRMPRAAMVSTTTLPSSAGMIATSNTISSASKRFVIGRPGSVTASPRSVTLPSRMPTRALARSTLAPTAVVPPASMPRRTVGSRKRTVPTTRRISTTASGSRAFQRSHFMCGTSRRRHRVWTP